MVVGNDVEIGANTTVDRARFGRTVIGRGVKIDNLCQIAHNVILGEHTALAAQTGIAGSSIVGRWVMMGGQAGVVGHVNVGDQVVVSAQAAVTKDVPAKVKLTGFPGVPHGEFAVNHANVARLPELKKRVAELERRLAALEKSTGCAAG